MHAHKELHGANMLGLPRSVMDVDVHSSHPVIFGVQLPPTVTALSFRGKTSDDTMSSRAVGAMHSRCLL